MAEGTKTYEGLAVPLLGESEIKAQSTTADIVTLTGASGGTGDPIVFQTYAGTEAFVVEDGGNVVITQQLAADIGLKITSAATPTGDFVNLNLVAGTKAFQVDKYGTIRTMAVSTVAIASLASNGSASFGLTGATTDDAVLLIPLKGLVTGEGRLNASITEAAKVHAYAAGGTTTGNTYAIWCFRTVAN
jgi:hypothetical protein